MRSIAVRQSFGTQVLQFFRVQRHSFPSWVHDNDYHRKYVSDDEDAEKVGHRLLGAELSITSPAGVSPGRTLAYATQRNARNTQEHNNSGYLMKRHYKLSDLDGKSGKEERGETNGELKAIHND